MRNTPSLTSITQPKTQKGKFFAPAKKSAPVVQRKYATGEEEKKVQRKASGENQKAPSIVDDAVNSGNAKPLDVNTQMFMGNRFGYDFSKVKIHDNTLAAKSAASVNANAYTSGNQIVFNEGKYNPSTHEGKKLLAHELTHVVQQRNGNTKLQRQPATVPPRGTNPGDCMEAICTRLDTARPPASAAAATTMVDTWLNDMLTCLRTNAPNSGASHHAEIVQNDVAELQTAAQSIRGYFSSTRVTPGSLRDFLESFRWDCRRIRREIGIEFRYNVIIDNSGIMWGLSPASDWDGIEAALATMPSEATWTSPSVLTFRRERVHATQPTVAGETDPLTNTITIFDRGFGTAPYPRSRATGIPSTTQTIQHEIGHVVVNRIPRPDYNNFFDNLLHWRAYSWAWITTPNSPHETWRAERNAFIAETGVNEARIDAWLQALPMDARFNAGTRSYFRTSTHVHAYDRAQVPTIPAFEYAASNRDDYLSELYTFCISAPEFVHQQLPQAQVDWLKRVVFNFPTDPNEILRRYAIGEPQQTEFIQRIGRLFTWQQVDMVFNQIMTQHTSGTTA